MSSWVSHAERAYASRGWKQPEHEFDCRICKQPVFEGYATEQGLEMESCRDCEGKRIEQLLAAERELVRVKRAAVIKLREIALAGEMTANDLEAR